MSQIITILDQVNGIDVIEGSQVQSLDDISVHHYQQLKQWDFDYISFSNNEDGETIGEGLI